MVLGLGTQELVIVVVVVLLLFGATAIPKLARSMGRAKGEFTKAKQEFDAELRKSETQAVKAGASEEQVRKSARDLGIDEAGKPIDEVKRLIAQKLA